MKNNVKRETGPCLHHIGSAVLFTLTLDGKYCTTVCADIGSAATLMNSSTLEKAQKAEFEANVVK